MFIPSSMRMATRIQCLRKPSHRAKHAPFTKAELERVRAAWERAYMGAPSPAMRGERILPPHERTDRDRSSTQRAKSKAARRVRV